MNIDQNKSNNESSKEAPPEFSDLFGGGSSEDSPMDLLFGEDSSKEKAGNDLSQKGFLPVEKLFEEKPLPIFAEKGYYQKALSGEGEPSKRFHNFLSQYLNSDDPKEKSAIRNKLISAYWDLTENISKKVFEDLPTPKKYALRFGAILPNLLSADLRKLLSVIIDENDTGEPIHYFDEWLEQISSGDINPSTTDELRPTRKKTDKENIKPQLDKHKGQEKSLINLIQRKQSNLVDYENILKEKVSVLMVKRPNPKYNGLNYAYSSDHRRAITELSMTIKDLNRIDKEISTLYSDLDKN
ncbi:MAG: hypothetical protein PQJ46_02925, partial [Spirochaetales bacterium]|nr:hypothetical protein [Spirochaetales bacterium]